MQIEYQKSKKVQNLEQKFGSGDIVVQMYGLKSSAPNVAVGASAYLISNGTVSEALDYLTSRHHGNAVRYIGTVFGNKKNKTDDQLWIKYSLLSPEYNKVVIGAVISDGSSNNAPFSELGIGMRILNPNSGEVYYDSLLGDMFPNDFSAILAEISREGDSWVVRTVNKAGSGDTLDGLQREINLIQPGMAKASDQSVKQISYQKSKKIQKVEQKFGLGDIVVQMYGLKSSAPGNDVSTAAFLVNKSSVSEHVDAIRSKHPCGAVQYVGKLIYVTLLSQQPDDQLWIKYSLVPSDCSKIVIGAYVAKGSEENSCFSKMGVGVRILNPNTGEVYYNGHIDEMFPNKYSAILAELLRDGDSWIIKTVNKGGLSDKIDDFERDINLWLSNPVKEAVPPSNFSFDAEKTSLKGDHETNPEMQKPKYCARCGAKLIPGANFCSKCGVSLATARVQAETTEYNESINFEESEALIKKGDLYYKESIGLIDYQKAAECYRDAAMLGNAEAMYKLGKYFYEGKGASANYEKAVEWYQKAAENGNADAMAELGLCYECGNGVLSDSDKAWDCYNKAAVGGSAKGSYLVGICYYNGSYVPRDYDKAIELFQKAAGGGYAEAHTLLGTCYFNGTGIYKDYKKAAQQFEEALAAGSDNAFVYHLLGMCRFRGGDGIVRDYAKSAELFKKAADRGDVNSLTLLGNIYYLGLLGEKNYAEAAKWYAKGAEAGFLHAMYMIGECYSKGRGVPKDKRVGKKWMDRAFNSGYYHETYWKPDAV